MKKVPTCEFLRVTVAAELVFWFFCDTNDGVYGQILKHICNLFYNISLNLEVL